MNIKELAQRLLTEQRENTAVILEIFQTGSNVFNVGRKKDDDYVVICENYGQRKRRQIVIENEIKYDILIMDKKAVEASLDFDDYIYIQNDIKLFGYFYDVSIRKIIYGNSNLNWSMLNQKTKYLNYAKDRFATTNYGLLVEPWKFGKHLVHYYNILKIYENNKAELNEQMLLDIKTLYGGTEEAMPIIEWIIAKMKEPKEIE
jgi:hypothetical protein